MGAWMELFFHVHVCPQWEAKVQRCQQEFDEISVVIKAEIERFELNRVRDFKATIIKYLQDQMAHQQQVCGSTSNSARQDERC